MPLDEANRKSCAASCLAASICAVTVLALAGCNSANGIGQLILVDPSQYDVYHCKDLSDQWVLLNKREAELRAEIDLEATLDALYGPIYYRLLVPLASLDAEWVETMARHVFFGLLTSRSVPPAGV